MPVNPASAPGFGMLDEYGRRLSARQKLTRETLVFFGNFTRQNGVVEHQLDIGFQAVTAGQLPHGYRSSLWHAELQLQAMSPPEYQHHSLWLVLLSYQPWTGEVS